MNIRKMRRFKQLLTSEASVDILEKGKYAVLAVSGDDDYPYTVPINYVYEGTCIYLHSAKHGHKIDAIIRNPKCSLCIVGKDDVVPEEFTSYFRSVIVFGKATIIESTEEKIRALTLLCDKYSPGINPDNEIEKFRNSVAVIRVDIEEFTGKEAIELVAR